MRVSNLHLQFSKENISTIIDNLSQSEGIKISEVQIMPRAYRNPTEDAAIGNVMREERMKQRLAAKNAVQPGKKKNKRERQRENRRLKHQREV